MDNSEPASKRSKISPSSQSHTMSPIIPLIKNEKLELPVLPSRKLPMTSCVGAESFRWVLCYSDDIHKYWRRMEQEHMVMEGYTNMAIVRPHLINIVRDIQTVYGLTNVTVHLVVYILDKFLGRNSENFDIKLLVVTALLVAAKFEDAETSVPPFSELNRTMLSGAFTLSEYRDLEIKMLISLDFTLAVPTVATFANFFSRISVVLEDFRIYKQAFDDNNNKQFQGSLSDSEERIMYVPFKKYDEMLKAVNQLMKHLVDLTLESMVLLNVLPSQKAAACVAAARCLYNVTPIWTPFLEMQCAYSEAEIRPVMEAIISINEIHVGEDSSSETDSSYATDTNDSNDDSSSTK